MPIQGIPKNKFTNVPANIPINITKFKNEVNEYLISQSSLARAISITHPAGGFNLNGIIISYNIFPTTGQKNYIGTMLANNFHNTEKILLSTNGTEIDSIKLSATNGGISLVAGIDGIDINTSTGPIVIDANNLVLQTNSLSIPLQVNANGGINLDNSSVAQPVNILSNFGINLNNPSVTNTIDLSSGGGIDLNSTGVSSINLNSASGINLQSNVNINLTANGFDGAINANASGRIIKLIPKSSIGLSRIDFRGNVATRGKILESGIIRQVTGSVPYVMSPQDLFTTTFFNVHSGYSSANISINTPFDIYEELALYYPEGADGTSFDINIFNGKNSNLTLVAPPTFVPTGSNVIPAETFAKFFVLVTDDPSVTFYQVNTT